MSFWRTLAILMGIVASILVVLAVATYEGYIPESLVGNLTDTELGTLGALAIVVAIFAESTERR